MPNLHMFILGNYWRQKGITFLELTISITLLVTTMALLATSLFQGAETAQRVEDRFNQRMETRILKNLLIQDLRSVVYLEEYTASGLKSKTIRKKLDSGILGIDGFALRENEDGETIKTDIDQIHMHLHRPAINSTPSAPLDDPEIHEVIYYLRENEEKETYSLYRQETFYIDEEFKPLDNNNNLLAIPDNGKSETLLSDNILGFNLEFTNQDLEDNKLWIKTWKSSEKAKGQELPFAVKIKIEMVGKDNKPELQEFEARIRPKFGSNIVWKF